MKARRNFVGVLVLAITIILCVCSPKLRAETIESALATAYQDNPQLNAQRAAVRVADENVPQALSGYRPKVGVTASLGKQQGSLTQQSALPGISSTVAETFTPFTYGISASQNLFNGFQTANRTRTAESQVQGARQALRVMEQTILLNSATIYMDVLRDGGFVQIQQSNVNALRQILEQTKKRFSRADVTATDVSEAEAQLAAAELALLAARSSLSTSRARYEAIIGRPPQNLRPGVPVDRFIPTSLAGAIKVGAAQNPNVTAAMYGVDVAYLQVKINEGALFPTLTVQAFVQQASEPQVLVTKQSTAAVLGQLSIPLYQGGGEYSLIRQSKETLGQQRLNLDLVLRQTRASVAQAWAEVEAARGQLKQAQVQVTAAEAAVSGLRKEILVGERTTLDLLIVQQNLVNARTALVTAQHDRVAASYSLLAAIGRLSPNILGLPTQIYDPQEHYQQVRDVWMGVRTPGGQ